MPGTTRRVFICDRRAEGVRRMDTSIADSGGERYIDQRKEGE
jgi:hypothetical protein